MIISISLISGKTLQYVIGIIATICIFNDAMHIGWPSPSLPKLYSNDSMIAITEEDGSWVVSVMMIGGMIGPFIFAFGSEYFGRKPAILLTTVLQLIAWIIIAFASNLPALCVARFIAGIADGLGTSSNVVYMAEIAEPEIRGKLGFLCYILYIIGKICIYCVGPLFSIQYVALSCAIFSLLQFLLCVFIPESPYYLLSINDKTGAEKALQMLRGKDNIKEELSKVTEAVTEQMSKNTSWKELFTVRSHLKALFTIFGLFSIMMFSGILVIASYSETIFNEAGTILSGSVSTILLGLCELFTSIVASFSVDRFGRKPILIISCIGSAMALGTQSIYDYLLDFGSFNMATVNWIPLMCLSLYTFFSGFGITPVPYLMVGEIFATNIIAKGSCLGILYSGLAAFIVTKFYPTLAHQFGSFVPFAGFAVACISGLAFVIYYVPETKGKTLAEIQDDLKKK